MTSIVIVFTHVHAYRISCVWSDTDSYIRLEPVDLAGAVVTFDALHTVRANLDWLVTDKKAHYIAVVT